MRSADVVLARVLVACALCALPGGCVHSHQVAPERGFSAERLATLTRVMQAEIDAKRTPGVVMLVARDGKLAYSQALGARDPKTGAPMTEDAIFRIYSMSKPIVSVGAMMLVEEGRLLLADPVSKYLPELKGMKVGVEKPGPDGKPTLELVPQKREMTVQDLMRHTSGISYEGPASLPLVQAEYQKLPRFASNEDFLRRLSQVPLVCQPGTAWEYGFSTDVLGVLVERLAGKPLEEYLHERILRPLRMVDTGFWVEPAKHARIAEPFAVHPQTKKPITLRAVRARRPFSGGGGGMVSTPRDYLRFAQMLLNGGELDGVRLLSRKTVELMASDHTGSIAMPDWLAGHGFGLGFAVRTAVGLSPMSGTVREFGWSGYAGTTFWVDPQERMVAVLMMQTADDEGRQFFLYRSLLHAAMR